MKLAHVINLAFGALCDAVMLPFRGMNPWAGLTVFSLVITVLALLAFKFFSSPTAIARARGRVIARVLELRLYRDNLFGIFATLGRVFLGTLVYLKEYLLPIGVLILPVVLILVQMSCWFDHRPLREGETTLFTVTLRADVRVMDVPMTITSSPNVVVESEPLRIPSENKIIWRFRAAARPWGMIAARTPDETVGMQVAVGPQFHKIAARRVAGGFFDILLNPADRPIHEGSVLSEMEISYPPREIGMNWLVACFILTLVFAWLLKPLFRVEL